MPRYFDVWSEPWVVHGFFGRQGGVSVGPYASLNLGYFVGDLRAAVDENWARVRKVAGEQFAIARANQVHRADVHTVDERNATDARTCDGMVTASRGVLLCILTADCVPIHVMDRDARIVGALHGGWRGILAGIVDAGVAAMERLGARRERIDVVTGPSIARCCFEVDVELADRFATEIPASRLHRYAGRAGKAMLDLRGIIRDRFISAGVAPESIVIAGECTKCAADRYFSRRAAGGGTTGLQLSFIGMAP
ncbi:MAG: peptidoglycan editing factor PgeF [Candidatus Binataceae bacterium]